jgi:hypothetical protein
MSSVLREGGDGMKAFLALISIVAVMLLGTESFAANCNGPVSAPTYHVGDRFIWQYAGGNERVWEVTGLEGNLAQVKWRDGAATWASENEGTYFIDQDWVIRKGVTKRGDVLLSPRVGAFSKLGIKDLDFPLQVGKRWEFNHQARFWDGAGISTFSWTLRVVGCEEVATLAGKFLALKIEAVESALFSGTYGTISRWYSPDAKNIVKVEFGTWGGIGAGTPYNKGDWSTSPAAYEIMKLELK